LGRLAVPRPSEPRLAASAADQVESAVAGASDPRVIQQMASRHGEATENSATVRPSWTPRSDQQPPSPPVPDKEREEAVKRTQSSYGPVPASSLTRSTAKGVLKSKAPETGARALGFSKMRRKLKKRSRNAPAMKRS